MRMWIINPELLCRKHLLGEHGELHKFLSSWKRKVSIKGRKGQMEPAHYKNRHDELAREMINRGYTHGSPLESPDFSYLDASDFNMRVDPKESVQILKCRCAECRNRIENFGIERDR
jgi:hypothetical protein